MSFDTANMGTKRKTKQKKPKPVCLRAQGADGGTKRTPLHVGDKAAGQQQYEVEAILQRARKYGIEHYEVKWLGWSAAHNTWEPITNLVGCEEKIRNFEDALSSRLAVAQERAEAKLADMEANRQARESARQRRIDDGALPDGDDEGEKLDDPADYKQHFDIGGPGVEEGYASCRIKGHKRCSHALKIADSTTPMINHLKWCHKAHWLLYDKAVHPEHYTSAHEIGDLLAEPFDVDVANRLVVLWLSINDRPLSMPSTDVTLQEIITYCLKAPSDSEWYLPNPDQVRKELLRLEVAGIDVAAEFVLELLADGLKPSVAGDIWSDKDVSLLGLVLYGINRRWEMVELLAVCTPFSEERHTNGEIRKKCDQQLKRVNMAGGLADSFQTVSDNGSNITKAFNDAHQSGQALKCTDHTLKLVANLFDSHPLVQAVTTKRHGCARILRRGNASKNLKGIQRKLEVPESRPNLDVATRWNADHDQCDWFEQNQQSVVMHDVVHKKDSESYAHEAGEAYGHYKLEMEDMDVIKDERAIMQTKADTSQMWQGTKYPTSPLVIPLAYKCIEQTNPRTTIAALDEKLQPVMKKHAEFAPSARAARKAVHEDLVLRFKTDLPDECKYIYCVSSVCHPCFKEFDFEGSDARLKSYATNAFKNEYLANWLPTDVEPERSPARPTTAATTPETGPRPTKKRKVGLSDLMGRQAEAPPAPLAANDPRTEAERYLKEVAQIADLGLDLLMWWRDIGSIKYPNLSRMARQFLGCPATSAGVERLFSKAGRAYNCLAKSQQEGTLEARMFVGINIDRVDLLDGHKLDSDSD